MTDTGQPSLKFRELGQIPGTSIIAQILKEMLWRRDHLVKFKIQGKFNTCWAIDSRAAVNLIHSLVASDKDGSGW